MNVNNLLKLMIMVIIKHYIDRVLSGKTDDKPSFLQRYQKFYTKKNNFKTFTI